MYKRILATIILICFSFTVIFSEESPHICLTEQELTQILQEAIQEAVTKSVGLVTKEKDLEINALKQNIVSLKLDLERKSKKMEEERLVWRNIVYLTFFVSFVSGSLLTKYLLSK